MICWEGLLEKTHKNKLMVHQNIWIGLGGLLAVCLISPAPSMLADGTKNTKYMSDGVCHFRWFVS